MYVIHVMPLGRGISAESLSYFSKENPEVGTLVIVPVRARATPALVLSTEMVRDAKTAIKSSSFSIKRIITVRGIYQLAPAWVTATKKMAIFAAAKEGAVIAALVPATILAHYRTRQPQSKSSPEHPLLSKKDVWMLQALDADRIAWYRSAIRESFNQGRSVFLCTPTVVSGEALWRSLSRGIEDRAFCVTRVRTKTKLIALWQGAEAAKHPVLVIASAQFLSLPRNDWGTIILEHESSRAYQTIARPYIDQRIFAEYFAQAVGARLVIGDTLVRPETFSRYERGEIGSILPPAFTIPLPTPSEVVDMRVYRSGNGTFRTISSQLEGAIRTEIMHGGQIFVLAARRGLASTTICNDCGNILRCVSCSAPVVLHRRDTTTQIFVCHACGTERESTDTCPSCGSWRFALLGVSTTRVVDELRQLFPKTFLDTLERDHAPTPKEAEKIVQSFCDTPGSILVGTEMALPYLPASLGICAVASVDALLALPDIRMAERLVRTSVYLRERAAHGFIFQTRMPDHPTLAHVLDRNLRPFYREELEAREQFGYPPFRTLIKITTQGKGDAPLLLRDQVERTLAPWSPQSYETSHGATMRAHLLLRVPGEDWPDKKLSEHLANLPPTCLVHVDPYDLLY
ncbi:MAG: hypothetical protein ACYC8S_03025 [Minisyncoccota bacterium]